METLPGPKTGRIRCLLAYLCLLTALLSLTGCLEQLQTTRIAGGSLSNFLLHLEAGEVDDALAYFAPGLVTRSAELDARVLENSRQVRKYEIRSTKATEQDAGGGQKNVLITAQIRPRSATSGDAWQETSVISATMVERGPGWRIIDYRLICCQ